MANKTYFNNKFDDYTPEAADHFHLNQTSDQISKVFQEKLQKFKTVNLDTLTNEMEADIFYDGTVYTGSAGLALYFFMQALNDDADSNDILKIALSYIDIGNLKGKRISFLCGDAGPLALATVISYRLGQEKPDDLPSYQIIARRLISLAALLNDSPNELLYGRVGYLYALLFVNKHTGSTETIPANHIEKVINTVLRSGKQLASQMKSDSPMLWQWHDKVYYGGAHGMAGILYVLLQALQYTNVLELRNFIKPTLDWLLGQQFPSGNFPSSRGSGSGDRLVQWCHGAPGVVPLCTLAYKIFEEEKYMEIALKCGDLVWERGLCSKGYSICHGVAGNAYTFIQLYQATKDPRHLYRACRFADWCVSRRPAGAGVPWAAGGAGGAGGGAEGRPPDRPASLFEGLAGRLYLVDDLMRVADAKFPAYTV